MEKDEEPQSHEAIVYDTSARDKYDNERFTALGYQYFSCESTIKHNPSMLTKQTQNFPISLENRLSILIQVHKCRYVMATAR